MSRSACTRYRSISRLLETFVFNSFDIRHQARRKLQIEQLESRIVLATFDVNLFADTLDGICDNNCSLRDAITEANLFTGMHTINLPSGNYSMTIPGSGEDLAASGDFDIRFDGFISGAGATQTFINGSGLDRVFDIIGSSVEIRDLTLQGGTENEGGGIRSDSTLKLVKSEVRSNTALTNGGGIFNTGTLDIINSTIHNNGAPFGAGLYNQGTATVTTSTFSTNAADSQGGGLNNATGSSVNLTNTTLASNSAPGGGGGIRNDGNLSLVNTVVALNSGSTTPDISGTVTSNGNNLIGDSTGGIGFSISDILDVDPRLGPLSDNGGSTQTHSPKLLSPLIDAANAGVTPPTDQRGISTTFDGDFNFVPAPDIGAVEVPHFIVNSNVDLPDATLPGDGVVDADLVQAGLQITLRAAIVEANFLGAALISLPSDTYGVAYAGTEADIGIAGDLDIVTDIWIKNTGLSHPLIRAALSNRVFDVHAGAFLLLEDVIITEGDGQAGGGGFGRSGSFDQRGGGLRVSGFAQIYRTQITANTAGDGGGIAILPGGGSVLYDVTIDNNSANEGAGIHNEGFLESVSSTISMNSSDTGGGGLFNAGTADLSYSTVADNDAAFRGGGIEAFTPVMLDNTILGSNTAGTQPDISGTIASGGHNVIGDSSGGTGFDPTDIRDVNPQIAPLGQNGGPTPTHALLPGSPAIDAADGLLGWFVDQRGAPRPVDGDLNGSALFDVGSYEYSPAQITFTAGRLTITDTGSAVIVSLSGGFVQINGFDPQNLDNPGQPIPPQSITQITVSLLTTSPMLVDLSVVEPVLFSNVTNVTIDTGAGDDTILGSGMSDHINGFDGDDLIFGGKGHDTILGGFGNDDLHGEAGGDLLDGQQGNDLVMAGSGKDTLDGADGNDTLKGGAGNDLLLDHQGVNDLSGESGDDTLLSGEGDDCLNGGTGNDLFDFQPNWGLDNLIETSGSGLDTVDFTSVPFDLNVQVGSLFIDDFTTSNVLSHGGSFIEVLLLGSGDDSIVMNSTASFAGGNGFIDAGAGIDWLDYQLFPLNVTVILNQSATAIGGIENFENVRGGSGSDLLVGHDGPNELVGLGGSDILDGMAGDDSIAGGNGNDFLLGGPGADTLDGGNGTDQSEISTDASLITLTNTTVSAEEIDSLASIEEFSIIAGLSDNTILLDQWGGNTKVLAGKGNDRIVGSSQDDKISGEWGNDTITGSLGNDALRGGKGIDTLIEFEDRDIILTNTRISGIGMDIATMFEFAHLSGGPSGNVLDASGFDFPTTLQGLAGDDTLFGGPVADSILGAAGNDFLDGGDGDDTLSASLGNDTISGGPGQDLLWENEDTDFIVTKTTLSGPGNNSLRSIEKAELVGGPSANTLTAESFGGMTTLRGSGGDDTLTGTNQQDVLDGGSGTNLIIGLRGDDIYEIISIATTRNSIIELGRCANLDGKHGFDTIDFSQYAPVDNTGITLDLRKTSDQQAHPNLTVLLSSGIAFEKLVGSDFGDYLSGNSCNNRLDGHLGRDRILGRTGDDLVLGGPLGPPNVNDRDTLNGGTGLDAIFANTESPESDVVVSSAFEFAQAGDPIDCSSTTSNRILGTDDADVIYCLTGTRAEIVISRGGNDFVFTGSGNDSIFGGLGDDVLLGGDGDDLIDGQWGNDGIYGLTGNDSLIGSGGGDLVDGGTGNDYSEGGAGNDLLIDSGTTTIDNDTQLGGVGDDTLAGGIGNDLLLGGEANDILSDEIIVKLNNYVLDSAEFDNRLVLIRGTGSDTLKGGPGDDTLNGGVDDDLLIGQTGNDLIVDIQVDLGRLDFTRVGSVTIPNPDETNRYIPIETGDPVRVIPEFDFNGDGNFDVADDIDLNNDGRVTPGFIVYRNLAYSLILSNPRVDLGSDDTLFGGSGDDTLAGGTGRDRLEGASGRDFLMGSIMSDQFAFSEFDSADDTLSGGPGADVLIDFQGDTRQFVASAADQVISNVRRKGFKVLASQRARLFGRSKLIRKMVSSAGETNTPATPVLDVVEEFLSPRNSGGIGRFLQEIGSEPIASTKGRVAARIPVTPRFDQSFPTAASLDIFLTSIF